MSYFDLSTQLLSLGHKTAEHHEKLEGLPLAKAAEALEKALVRFSKRLEEFLGNRGPGIQELEELLKSPQAKAHLTLPALNLIAKGLFPQPLNAEKIAAARKEFMDRVKKERVGENAVQKLKQFFYKAAERPVPSKDEISLQKELLHLGGLSDDELAFEFSGRLKSIPILKALAKANAIPFGREIGKEKLIELITHYARRAHSNIRHRYHEMDKTDHLG
jgi:hypothetical protein